VGSASAAARALEHVDEEAALHELRPRRAATARAVAAGWAPALRFATSSGTERDAGPPAARGRELPVVAEQVGLRRGDERDEPEQDVEPIEDEARCAVAPHTLEAHLYAAIVSHA
jgi:hypothetical protein